MDEKNIKNLQELLISLRQRRIPPSDYKEHIDRFLENKAREHGTPLSASFELTPLCNLDCKMCFVHLRSAPTTVPLEKWKGVISQAHAMGMVHASLTGGECLTHPQFAEIYRYFFTLGIKVSILTNGILLEGKILDLLTEYKPRCIFVTLYGSSEDAYEKVTGHRVFRKVLNNIREVIKRGINIQLNITPNRFMYEDAESLLQTAFDLGIPYHINSKLMQPREATGRGMEDLTDEEYVRIYKLNNRLKGYATPVGNVDELPAVKQAEDVQKGLWCGAGRSHFSMRWDGFIYPCNSIDDLRESILSQSFSEAWEKVHRGVSEYLVPRECPDCIYKDVCLRCVAMHKNSPDRTHCDPRMCSYTKTLIQEGITIWKPEKEN